MRIQSTIAFAVSVLLLLLLALVVQAQTADENRLRNLAASDHNLAAVRELLRKGVNPNVPDNRGGTAVHHAAGAGALGILDALLQANGDPDVQDRDGNTPLHLAADASSAVSDERESAAVMRVLLKHRADPRRANRDGEMPLHIAARTHGRPSSAGVEALLGAGAPPNRPNRRGDTPLHAAVGRYATHSAGVIGALLASGARPGATNGEGMTPLQLLVRHGADTGGPVTVLLRGGANPNRKAPDGSAPLHTAIRMGGNRGKVGVVKALLAGNADPCVRDAKGFIPYNIAREGGVIHQALDRVNGYDRACDKKKRITSGKRGNPVKQSPRKRRRRSYVTCRDPSTGVVHTFHNRLVLRAWVKAGRCDSSSITTITE